MGITEVPQSEKNDLLRGTGAEIVRNQLHERNYSIKIIMTAILAHQIQGSA